MVNKVYVFSPILQSSVPINLHRVRTTESVNQPYWEGEDTRNIDVNP